MKDKFKVLALGVLAAMALVATTGGSATAVVGGHFVSESEHTILQSVSDTQHSYTFKAHSGLISCTPGTFKHEGTFTGKTVESITLFPSYGEGGGCSTEGGTPISLYTYNGCSYKLTAASGTNEQTMHFDCPAGKVLEFHQPNCLATMPPQTVEKAATSTTTEVNGKHALTVDLHATFETQYHGGLCVFLGTKQSATLQGTAVIKGRDTVGNSVSITAT